MNNSICISTDKIIKSGANVKIDIQITNLAPQNEMNLLNNMTDIFNNYLYNVLPKLLSNSPADK
ncbi:hypothetical protein [Clostridium tyrobutyricum]|jgi:hypothetical protein|uniref:hypothetical protein n=1 Tax=Clostridium tyrobutyricum TaxID=1519 RepID=UPI001C386DA3|nr:hypothetical protein [Clostridium tyrobutyricum]MBV4441135.1 hypothetical protein [Clostridium tyrobutyricum]